MRLCYVGRFSHIHMRRWVGFFGKQGHEIHVVSTDGIPPASIQDFPGIQVHPMANYRTGSYLKDLAWGAVSLPLRVNELRCLFQRISPDAVHVHYVNEAAFYSILTGFRPILITAWGSDILVSPKQSWSRRQAVRYIVSRADLITCDAEHVKQEIIGYGAKPARVRVVYFGTDVEKYRPENYDQKLRERLSPGGNPIVISIRNLEPVYDVATVIRAIPAIRRHFPEVMFLIGGSGSMAGVLKELVSELGVQHNVRFLGALSQEDLPNYLASSDVYVSTALSDAGIAASTAEAMASVVPVIITDVADNRQWIEDGTNGYLIPPRDHGALAEKTIELLGRSDARSRMGSAGRETIVERNCLQKEMGKMEEFYRESVEWVRSGTRKVSD